MPNVPDLKFDYNDYNKKEITEIISSYGDLSDLKILYFSTYFKNYTRTEVLLDVLREAGVDNDQIFFEGRFKYIKALWYFFRNKKTYDVFILSFRAHEILPFVRALTKKPIIFDAFVSIYDTLCFDREMFCSKSLVGKLLRVYDKFLCRISDTVLVDTNAHKQYFIEEFGADNVSYIYVGANDRIFKPIPVQREDDRFSVFWYGQVNPLQGLDIILEAARLLEHDTNIFFKIVGPVQKKAVELYGNYQLTNVEYVDFIPYEELPVVINHSDVCLGGHFSTKQKAARVIAGKSFQFLACSKPTILAENPANRELFQERKFVHFVQPGDPQSLADKILELSSK